MIRSQQPDESLCKKEEEVGVRTSCFCSLTFSSSGALASFIWSKTLLYSFAASFFSALSSSALSRQVSNCSHGSRSFMLSISLVRSLHSLNFSTSAWSLACFASSSSRCCCFTPWSASFARPAARSSISFLCLGRSVWSSSASSVRCRSWTCVSAGNIFTTSCGRNCV